MLIQQAWLCARLRQYQCGSKKAWSLVVESAWKQMEQVIVDAEIADPTEADRLQRNCRHLRAHVELLHGNGDIRAEDLQNASKALEREFLQAIGRPVEASWLAEDSPLTTDAVRFRSADLPHAGRVQPDLR